jgi:hypothetical protein
LVPGDVARDSYRRSLFMRHCSCVGVHASAFVRRRFRPADRLGSRPSARRHRSPRPDGTLTSVQTSPTFVPVPVIATRLDLVVTKVHQLIRDGQLLAVRVQGVLRVPAEFVADGLVVKGLPATITLLRDAGYGDDEIINWLFTPEESLPGRPIDALRENRGREVHRRAQVAGF